MCSWWKWRIECAKWNMHGPKRDSERKKRRRRRNKKLTMRVEPGENWRMVVSLVLMVLQKCTVADAASDSIQNRGRKIE